MHCQFGTFLLILTIDNTFQVEQIISPVAQYSGLLQTVGATRLTKLHLEDVLHSISCQLGLSVAHEWKEEWRMLFQGIDKIKRCQRCLKHAGVFFCEFLEVTQWCSILYLGENEKAIKCFHYYYYYYLLFDQLTGHITFIQISKAWAIRTCFKNGLWHKCKGNVIIYTDSIDAKRATLNNNVRFKRRKYNDSLLYCTYLDMCCICVEQF